MGLIITEGTFIDEPSASPSSNYPNFFGGAPLRGWKKVLEAVHTTDCKIAPQLWHVGMARPFKGENLPNPELPPIGPSGIDVNTLRQTTDPMSAAKIEEVIDAFARAAADAKRLGFDGVEIHGAHGYLIDQFTSAKWNHRTDEYGGSFENRQRFLREIVEEVRKACGKDYPIAIKMTLDSVDDDERPIEEGLAIAKYLADSGLVDMIHFGRGAYSCRWRMVSSVYHLSLIHI